MLREATGGSYTQPVLTQNAAEPPDSGRGGARAELPSEPVPQAAEAAETVAMRGGAFIAPKPVDAGPGRPVPLAQPAVPAAPPPTREAAAKPKGRMPSLIERVTRVGRARQASAELDRTARQPIPPAINPAQPRLGSLEPEDRPGSNEDDLLDIPAFLRRQAN